MTKIISSLLLAATFITPQVQASEVDPGLKFPELGESYNSFEVAQNRGRRSGRKRSSGSSPLAEALSMAKNGQYMEASMKLFQLTQSSRYRSRRNQIKYVLGLMLYQMKLNQVAAFQFIGVIRHGKNRYLKQSLEKLSLAADALGDDTLLNYAISRVKVDDFPKVHRDMLYFRIGEFQLRNQQHRAAARSFSRVRRSSQLFPKAKYLQGLALAEASRLKAAVTAFEDLIETRAEYGVTDSARVAGVIGKARVLYQRNQWEQAIAAYREVPRDTELWHDTLFESSWAMLRSGKFRSALSNFHSLHSAYYEDFYLPESLLLRSIVYLYICKYEEMEKVLNLFTRIYGPVFKDINDFLEQAKQPKTYFNEAAKVIKAFKEDGEDFDQSKFALPLLVVRKIAQEGDFKNSFDYIRSIIEERKRLRAMPPAWRESAIGKYSEKVLQTRLLKARDRAGRQIRAHLEIIKEELVDLFEQEGFIRFEMINGKKESIKKRIAGKDLPTQVDEERSRDFYVQNGYEYWKFQGEYWLDELGNYHYVGTQSCQ